VPLSKPSFTGEDFRRLSEAFNSGWWTYGPVAREVEVQFAAYLGVRHALAVSSGTAALHLAYLALGAGVGDEVVTPSLTFVAAANTILQAGAHPRFTDVQSVNRPTVSAATIERAVTPETRGICVMHYAGYPCAMDEIMEFAGRRGLWVVEDAAHAVGASLAGVRCGAWGDIGCFSFFGNKNITCAEGGMVVTNRVDLANRLRALRSHGMTSLTWDRFRGHQFSYDVTLPGFNYRMDDLRASILDVQLRSLDRLNELRRERLKWYRELLQDDPRWTIPFQRPTGEPAGHLFVIVLSEAISRDRVMSGMRNLGIQTSIHYPPIHQFSYYRNMWRGSSSLTVTEDLGRRLLTLPLYPDLTREQVELVCVSLREAVEC
jgi:dTDP-4-amino-4,6-dideoxygalactose transaminase